MIQSLLLKLGMLAVTIGIVLWIGWAAQPLYVFGPPGERPVASAQDFSRNVHQTASETSSVHTPVSLMPGHGLVDLNRASARELETLPGIGAALAQRVIAWRESIGGFRRIEELRNVKGIGTTKFDRIKSLVTVTEGNLQRATEQREL